MINDPEYLHAVERFGFYKAVIDSYHRKHKRDVLEIESEIEDHRNEFLQLGKNDYIRYVGGSESKYLIEGDLYRLINKPHFSKYSGRIFGKISNKHGGYITVRGMSEKFVIVNKEEYPI